MLTVIKLLNHEMVEYFSQLTSPKTWKHVVQTQCKHIHESLRNIIATYNDTQLPSQLAFFECVNIIVLKVV